MCFLFVCFVLFSETRVSWYPRTHPVDQASPDLGDPPPSASQVLRLKMCTTTAYYFERQS